MNYQLPCECGRKVTVEARQAGTTVACPCGRSHEVPRLTALAQITSPPADTSPQTVPDNLKALGKQSYREQGIPLRRRIQSIAGSAIFVVVACLIVVGVAAWISRKPDPPDPPGESADAEMIARVKADIQGGWRNRQPAPVGGIVEFHFTADKVTLTDIDGEPLTDIDGKPLTDIDGKPLTDIDGKPLTDIDGKPKPRSYEIFAGSSDNIHDVIWREGRIVHDGGVPRIESPRMQFKHVPILAIEGLGSFTVILETDTLNLKTPLSDVSRRGFGYDLKRIETD